MAKDRDIRHVPSEKEFLAAIFKTGLLVFIGALVTTVCVTWLTTHDYEPSIHHQAIRTAFFLPLIIVPACISIVGRQSLLNHRLMLEATRLALTDEMTGLANRRSFYTEAQETLEATDLELNGIAIFIIDLDHFKKVNDLYGHDAGDKVLIHAAKQLERAVPHGSLVCRLGGEEFAVLLTYRSFPEIHEHAEEIRQRIASKPCQVGDYEISVTASVGAGVAHARDSVKSVMTRADNALYEAKHEGRNRFTVAA